MAVRAQGATLVIAIVLIVLGALVLLGEVSAGEILSLLGIALIVFGILMLVSVVAGGTLLGVALLVLGILLELDFIGIPREIARVINIIVGVVLLVFGIIKLVGR